MKSTVDHCYARVVRFTTTFSSNVSFRSTRDATWVFHAWKPTATTSHCNKVTGPWIPAFVHSNYILVCSLNSRPWTIKEEKSNSTLTYTFSPTTTIIFVTLFILIYYFFFKNISLRYETKSKIELPYHGNDKTQEKQHSSQMKCIMLKKKYKYELPHKQEYSGCGSRELYLLLQFAGSYVFFVHFQLR